MGGGGGTVGRAPHSLRARLEAVCVSGSWCALAGCLLAAPPSDTTVGPLWISFTPPLHSCSTTCPSCASALPGRRPGRLPSTFNLLAPSLSPRVLSEAFQEAGLALRLPTSNILL